MEPQLTPIYLKISTKLKESLKKEARKHRVSMAKFIADAVELVLNSKPHYQFKGNKNVRSNRSKAL